MVHQPVERKLSPNLLVLILYKDDAIRGDTEYGGERGVVYCSLFKDYSSNNIISLLCMYHTRVIIK